MSNLLVALVILGLRPCFPDQLGIISIGGRWPAAPDGVRHLDEHLTIRMQGFADLLRQAGRWQ
ncbi:MAG: hypothetical protein WAN10_17390 [Candidatus Acidiferrales bacterium]